MKVTTSTPSIVASNGVNDTSSFSIANSSHMYNILSNGLYSDKIGAVLREIGANAMDAHIMVNKPDLPFEVKLPSKLDSTFYIKDFGPGLSDFEIRRHYTTFGWSNKEADNRVTGGFGLGSKSPLAYTDAFSICTVQNGVKNVYTAYKDDQGSPVVSLMSTSEPDEDWASGVMITFSVPPEDVQEFSNKAAEIYQWFRVTPTIVGSTVKVKQPSFKVNGTSFGLSPASGDSSSKIIMANVAYPLNSKKLTELSKPAAALLGCGIHLFMPTGSVIPTPNREDIQYDKKSRQAISEALDAAAMEVAKEIYERVKAVKAEPWEWHRSIQTYGSSLPGTISWAIENFLELVTQSPEELRGIVKLFKQSVFTMPHWVGDGRDGHPNEFRVWMYYWYKDGRRGNVIRRKEVTAGCYRLSSQKSPEEIVVQYTSDVSVMVIDAARADARVKWLMNQASNDKFIFTVQPVRGSTVEQAKQYAKRLASDEGFGGVPVSNVSEIAIPAAVVAKVAQARKSIVELREEFQEEELPYFSVIDPLTPESQMLVSEMEDSDKFFVIERQARYSEGYVNYVEGERSLYQNYTADTIRAIVSHLAALRQIEKIEGMTGFFVVTPDQLRLLKLQEDGWKPAYYEITRMTHDAQWIKALSTHADIFPELDLSNDWDSNRAGLAGRLARMIQKQPDAAVLAKLKELLPGHPILQLAQKLVTQARKATGLVPSSSVPKSITELPVTTLVYNLNRHLAHTARLSLQGLTRMSAVDINILINKAYPRLELLDVDKLFSAELCLYNSELVASLLWQFLSLTPNPQKDVEPTLLRLIA